MVSPQEATDTAGDPMPLPRKQTPRKLGGSKEDKVHLDSQEGSLLDRLVGGMAFSCRQEESVNCVIVGPGLLHMLGQFLWKKKSTSYPASPAPSLCPPLTSCRVQTQACNSASCSFKGKLCNQPAQGLRRQRCSASLESPLTALNIVWNFNLSELLPSCLPQRSREEIMTSLICLFTLLLIYCGLLHENLLL